MSASEACINENLSLSNGSVADNYEWEFCNGGVSQGALGIDLGSISEVNSPNGIEAIYDQGNYYAFVTSTNNSKIIRLDYGANLGNAPSVVDLGNFSGAINGPIAISARKIADEWLVFVANQSIGLVRLNFGNDITDTNPNVHTYSGLVDFVSVTTIRDIELVLDNGEYKLLASGNNSSGTIAILNLGSSPSTNNAPLESSFEITGATSIPGISLVSDCQEWVGLAVDYLAGLKKINFGSTINDTPSIESISGLSKGVEIETIAEKGGYYGLAMTDGGDQFYRINFNGDISNTPTIEPFSDLGLLNRAQGFGLVKSNGNAFGIALNRSSRDLTTINFSYTCQANINYSTQETPDRLSYITSGTPDIYLKGFNDDHDGIVFASQTVTINMNTAPSISFTFSNNECITQPNTFTPNDLGLVSYEWSFDGGLTSGFSSTGDTTHTFTQVGDSVVLLTVSDGTCTNFVKDTISIYPEPVAPTFSTPGTPYCTGANLTFENLFDESNYSGATLTYDWDYNGEGNTNERDGVFSFNTSGTKTITLTASIPGCSTPSAGTDINLIAGPDVNFSFENLCLGDQTQFTNSTTGTGITGQSWDFGDGSGTSSASSPSYSYSTHGNYDVSLTVNNNQGCSNELIQAITIEDKPVAAFNYGPACEGVNIAFEDGSTVGGLANITSYEWDFEGLGSSTNQNPNFTFDHQGSYDVELIVETTAGCRDTVASAVNVLLAPMANFEVDLGCINTETVFLDRSEGDFSNPITQWVWTIDGSLASYSSSFGEVYNDPGDHTISLQVRSANNCQAIHNDTFTISELPVANFTTEKECDNEYTVFQDATASPAADIVSRQWVFDDEHTSSTNPASHLFSNAGNYAVALTVVDEAGCEGSIQKTVTIHPSPQAQLSANTDIGPAPLTIDFADVTEEVSTSLWMFGDDKNSASTERQPQFTYNEWGDYQAQLIATNDLGCSDTSSMLITVADPILDLELEQISTEESEGRTNITLTVKNNGNIILNGFDIRIDLDNNSSIFEKYSGTLLRGQSVSYQLNFTLSSAENNIGYACITVEDQVDDFNDINIVNNERCIDFNQQLVVENSYPNPVKSTDSKIRVNMILPSDAPVQIFLLDATGAILFQEIYMEARSGLNSFFLDIYSFEQGMYFIKTVYNQQESTQRFVKL